MHYLNNTVNNYLKKNKYSRNKMCLFIYNFHLIIKWKTCYSILSIRDKHAETRESVGSVPLFEQRVHNFLI